MDGAIGIIGGMGPLATELFYKMVTTHTAVQSDQGACQNDFTQRYLYAGPDCRNYKWG